jgi:hypothetical protein
VTRANVTTTTVRKYRVASLPANRELEYPLPCGAELSCLVVVREQTVPVVLGAVRVLGISAAKATMV